MFLSTVISNLKGVIKNRGAAQIFYCLFTAWMFVSIAFVIRTDKLFYEKEFYAGINFWLFCLCVVLMWFALYIFTNEKVISVIMLFSVVVYSVIAGLKYSDFLFSIGCSIVVLAVVYFSKLDKLEWKISNKALWIMAVSLVLAFTAIIGIALSFKYANYRTSCYDFGIFSQMFYYMKETGLPLTTCERDGLLSHFAVHFSPIFYLMLPFYYILPSPVTLQVLSCLVVASGVIPLVLIVKRHGMSNLVALGFSVVYTLYPVLVAGTQYNLHENNFLAPIVLWCFWAFETKKILPCILFSVLLLSVKEDAAMYLAIIALYFIITGKNLKLGIPAFALSVVYFFIVTMLLENIGEGVMTYRYSNYIYDDSENLTAVIKSVIQNPVFVLHEIFTEEKFTYILQVLSPLAFLPLFIKDPKRIVLLIPFILVNLMSNYQYQHALNYQYGFGSGAFLIYLAVINYEDIKNKRSKILICAMAFSLITAIALVFPRTKGYYQNFTKDRTSRITIDSALDLIPEDASVSCTTYLVPNLSTRRELYELEHTKDHDRVTEYYAIDLRQTDKRVDINDYLNNSKYEQLYYKSGVIAVFKSV